MELEPLYRLHLLLVGRWGACGWGISASDGRRLCHGRRCLSVQVPSLCDHGRSLACAGGCTCYDHGRLPTRPGP